MSETNTTMIIKNQEFKDRKAVEVNLDRKER